MCLTLCKTTFLEMAEWYFGSVRTLYAVLGPYWSETGSRTGEITFWEYFHRNTARGVRTNPKHHSAISRNVVSHNIRHLQHVLVHPTAQVSRILFFSLRFLCNSLILGFCSKKIRANITPLTAGMDRTVHVRRL